MWKHGQKPDHARFCRPYEIWVVSKEQKEGTEDFKQEVI